MAKRDPVRQCTDEFLLRAILADPRPDEKERIALRVALDDVRRLRPMTHTRAKLSTKQRATVEARFKALELDEGLKERLVEFKGTSAASMLDPLIGVSAQFLHPTTPPGKVEMNLTPYARWCKHEKVVLHNALRCGVTRVDIR